MWRGTLPWISLLVMAAGCRMCASPYDYCSPTFTGQCGEDCAPMARAGSILSGYFPPVPTDPSLPDQVPDLPDAPELQPAPNEGVAPPGVAFSVTESELASETGGTTDADLGDALPEEMPPVEAVRRLSSDGWTSAERTPSAGR